MNDDLKLIGPVDLSDSARPIVMVDDEELDFISANRAYKRSKLTNQFIRFENGMEFLTDLAERKQANEKLPALVLMDINMPRMNGFEVVEELREDEYFTDVPIVAMLTSSTDNADKIRAEEVGANSFLVKPYDPKEYTIFFDSLVS